jgi:predicted RNase H-like HicB family nuclease
MDYPVISFTAVYLKSKHGYVGFIEELPGVNAHGQSIEEARANLQGLATVIFDLERAQAKELLEGKDVMREGFSISVAPVV